MKHGCLGKLIENMGLLSTFVNNIKAKDMSVRYKRVINFGFEQD